MRLKPDDVLRVYRRMRLIREFEERLHAEIQTGKKFAALGMQIAAGVPLQCDEGPDYKSFRLGLFGLDKLYDVDASVARLENALDLVFPQT